MKEIVRIVFFIILWGVNGYVNAQTINKPTLSGSNGTQNNNYQPTYHNDTISATQTQNINGDTTIITQTIDNKDTITIINNINAKKVKVKGSNITNKVDNRKTSKNYNKNSSTKTNKSSNDLGSNNKTQESNVNNSRNELEKESEGSSHSKKHEDNIVKDKRHRVPQYSTPNYYYYGSMNEFLPNGEGEMIILVDNYRINRESPIVANKGDIVKGYFEYGIPKKYTHINNKGEILRIDHVPSDKDVVFKIDSVDLKNGPLLQNKHIDITIGDMLAEWNTFNKTGKLPDMNKFENIMSPSVRKQFETFWNLRSNLGYNRDYYKDTVYNIQKDSKGGSYISIKMENNYKVGDFARNSFILPLYFDSNWQIPFFYRDKDTIDFSPDIDDATRLFIEESLVEFRAAYRHKQIDTLKLMFDKYATIIVGRIREDGTATYRKYASLSDNNSTTDKYFINLRSTFARERSIRLDFENIKVTKKDEDMYQIRLHQRWKAFFYHDIGELQMLWEVDTKNKTFSIISREWAKDGNFKHKLEFH